jgi:DNA-binding transcriptional MerR regulator
MMGQYSIKELEQLSGIKAHTIRIWEKRYNLIEPQRTATNIRFYSDEDLKKIINVSVLNTNGIKISKIAEMSPDKIAETILALNSTSTDTANYINQLTSAMVDLDEEKFESILSGLFHRSTFEQTITGIVYPFLEKIGVLWQTHNITPAQEHFISNLIRQKLIVAIDSLPLPPRSGPKVLLFLPENELHELGLLFSHYLLRKAGYQTFYLGQAVPHADLMQVFNTHQPHMLITAITTAISKAKLFEYLRRLTADLPCARILVGGSQVQNIDYQCPVDRLRIVKTVVDLKANIISPHIV